MKNYNDFLKSLNPINGKYSKIALFEGFNFKTNLPPADFITYHVINAIKVNEEELRTVKDNKVEVGFFFTQKLTLQFDSFSENRFNAICNIEDLTILLNKEELFNEFNIKRTVGSRSIRDLSFLEDTQRLCRYSKNFDFYINDSRIVEYGAFTGAEVSVES